MSHDNQIKEELSALKLGMMLPLSDRSSLPTAPRATSGRNCDLNFKEPDIAESIEHDDEEELADIEAEDEEMDESARDDEEDEDEDKGISHEARKSPMGPPALPVTKKSNTFTSGCAPQ